MAYPTAGQADAWDNGHGSAPLNAEPHPGSSEHSELQKYATNDFRPRGAFPYDSRLLAGWLDLSETSIDPGISCNQLQPLGPGYLTVPLNSHLVQSELQSQQSIDEFAQQLQAEQSIDVFSNGAPWYPGSRLDRNSPPIAQEDHDLQPVYPVSFACGATLYGDTNPFEPTSTFYESPRSSRSSTGTLKPLQKEPGLTLTLAESQADRVTTCGQCGAQFTGRFRRGNCSRHVRQQHSRRRTTLKSDCICRICKKTFNRQDARRKHEWKQHGLPDAKPCPRRQANTEGYEVSEAGTNDHQSDQDMASLSSSIGQHTSNANYSINPHYRLPTYPHNAISVFSTIRKKLDVDTYDVFCRHFVARWQSIVEELRINQFNAHAIFAQVLCDLYFQLLPDQRKPSDSTATNDGDAIDVETELDTESNRNTGASQGSGKAPASKRTARATSRFTPYTGRSTQKSSGDPAVTIAERFEMHHYQQLDCPVHKWHVMHGLESPCGGCGKEYPKDVRQHLDPDYTRQHLEHVSFIKYCRRCKDDIVKRDSWVSGGHAAYTCSHRNQPRKSAIIIWWARLFLNIFPDAVIVPSLYKNDPRYLPNELVALIRADLQLPSASQPSFPQVNSPSRLADVPDSDTEMNREAVWATVMNDAQSLLASVGAEAIREAAGYLPLGEDVVTEYRRRLDRLHENYMNEVTQASQPDQHDINQTATLPTDLHQPRIPITGGADDFDLGFDFPTLHFQSDPSVGMVQVPESDMSTQSSSQDYYHNSGFSSYLPSYVGSSQTSYDVSSFMVHDQAQTTPVPSQATPVALTCPSLYFLETQLSPSFDVTHPPQPPVEQFGNARMNADVDLAHDSQFYPPLDFDTSPELDHDYNNATNQGLSDID